ncbi:11S globulin seed storage protein 2-like [Rhodamnia argentea]|uniref:11S globulin seed storage protein 2-like n=1 Tax=Rhodamnia argentea TaxID=178133 RepID=A0A8B8MYU2_9MYRT|nr:11S globulin seed storage protein 2-like [Rhodamnia argentea]
MSMGNLRLPFLAATLCLLVHVALGKGSATTGLDDAQQCRLWRIRATQPDQRFESEGGFTELWSEDDDQFQCAGVAAVRNILHPNALFLPEFINAPRLVFIEQGRGLLGINYPGCPETYHSGRSSGGSSGRGRRWQEEGQQGDRGRRDQHQKVHRIRRGDIIAIPEGTVHWCHNDGNEELIAISIIDLNNQGNQLDQRLRAFFLAGGFGGQGRQQGRRGGRYSIQNIFQAFDTELLAESYNVPMQIAQRLQQQNNRGIMIDVGERLRVVAPEEDEEYDEEYEEEQEERMRRRRGQGGRWSLASENWFDEMFCTMRIKQNVDIRREADVFSRQAGRVNVVDMHKLPILRDMDMSAERGRLLPNALYTPHWSMTDHRIVYVTRGEAHVQIVGQDGQNVFDERVSEGSMFVIPQFYATVSRAGDGGFEWITFKTSSQPMKSPLAGYTSVFRALPLEVITNSFQMSPRDAQELKYNREHQTFLLSPSCRSRSLSD